MHTDLTLKQQADAVLSYAESLHTFKNFDEDHPEKGVCLANLGSIMCLMNDFRTAIPYYEQSIENKN